MSPTEPRLKVVILSCSLSPESKSRRLARLGEQLLKNSNVDVRFCDARYMQLPQFDHSNCYRSEEVAALTSDLSWADSVVIALPIYNWGGNSVAKNIVELTGNDDTGRRVRAWEDKVVSFICTAGLPQSYMAHLPFANSLMLDYKCIINPYVAFATDENFGTDYSVDEQTSKRLERSLVVGVELATLLALRTYKSKWSI